MRAASEAMLERAQPGARLRGYQHRCREKPLSSEYSTYKTFKALAFRYKSLNPVKVFPLRSEADLDLGAASKAMLERAQPGARLRGRGRRP